MSKELFSVVPFLGFGSSRDTHPDLEGGRLRRPRYQGEHGPLFGRW